MYLISIGLHYGSQDATFERVPFSVEYVGIQAIDQAQIGRSE